jgi:asparagine synthase (glutamine-hydrolysing)
MCGIVGFTGPSDKEQLNKMVELVRHRGPDDKGTYSDGQMSLGHARLSIIDLEGGKQPIHNKYENIWVVFNGEIYNYRELRAELERDGFQFYTKSDTEVIVNGYEKWGVRVFERLNGDFAIALWDRVKKQLVLARDRIGIKPLYYACLPHRFVFASEIKALLCWDQMKRQLDEAAFREFMCFQYALGERTLFKGVRSVLPGHYLVYSREGIQQKPFWQVSWEPRHMSEEGAVALIRSKLAAAVKARTVADVPIGAFLSGGLDSSYVVALLSRALSEPVKTFTVGFGEGDDELDKARAVADAFGTDHKELEVRASPALIPKLTWHNDLPVVDIAALPTYLMAQATKPFVSVVLTGDGGDEMFAGYERYERVKQWFGAPLALRNTAVDIASKVSSNPLWQRLKEFSGFEDQEHAFLAYQSSFSPVEMKELTGDASLPRVTESFPPERALLNNMFAFDTANLLPNDYLPKVDRMTMAHGLEARVPFLDHNVVEFCAGIPPELKTRGGKKYLLKKAMSSLVPEGIITQRKHGFNVPTERWLEGELGELAESALSGKRLVKLFKPTYVRKVLSDFHRHPRYYSRQFWTIYSFQAWWDMFIEPETLDFKAMAKGVVE